jgi:GNAT superfamily N-acetyltransferase
VTEVIREAASRRDYDAFGRLIAEYLDWCIARYASLPGMVEQAFAHQSMAAELDILPEKYGPPNGRTIVAEAGDEIIGCIAYRRIPPEGTCEMKRLFIPARHQKAGLGRQLCERIIAAARADGLKVMRLETGDLFHEAIALYRKLGFRECPHYTAYPAVVQPHIVTMELALG